MCIVVANHSVVGLYDRREHEGPSADLRKSSTLAVLFFHGLRDWGVIEGRGHTGDVRHEARRELVQLTDAGEGYGEGKGEYLVLVEGYGLPVTNRHWKIGKNGGCCAYPLFWHTLQRCLSQISRSRS